MFCSKLHISYILVALFQHAVLSACSLPSCASLVSFNYQYIPSPQADVMLVKNAQNLMQAVVKTVQAAESACMKVNSNTCTHCCM